MKRIFVFCGLAFAFIACHKDKVESTPHLTFKSFNSDPIYATDPPLVATLEFTDQEGDLDSVFMTRQRTNSRGRSYINVPYSGIPSFGNQNRGELAISIPVQSNLLFNLLPIKIPGSNPAAYQPDTLLLRFYIKDKAGHVSDTASAKQLIVIR